MEMKLGFCELKGETGHTAGRRLLAELYEAETGLSLPEIATTPRGKPYFVDSSWHFSITHTRHYAFCAFSQTPIGIDAEELDRDIDLRLAEKMLSPSEFARYEQAENKRLALLTFWVLKEAQAKFTGEGLHGYPDKNTDFSLTDSRVYTQNNCLLAIIEE